MNGILFSEANGELTTTERRVRLRRVYNRQSRCKDLTINDCKVIAVSGGS